MRIRFTLVTAALPFVAWGCSSSIPSQRIGTTAPVPVVRAAPVVDGPWLYHAASQQRSMMVDQQATVEIRGDTLTRTDTLSLHVETTFAFSGTTHVSGSVVAYRVQSGAGLIATPAGLAVPFSFSGDFPKRGQQLELTRLSPQTGCSAAAHAAAQSLRDLWIQPPDTLRVGTAWEDSSTYSVCRDGVPLRSSNRRQFRVTAKTDHDGHALLSITRHMSGTLAGEGAQSGEPIAIVGVSSGDLTYQLMPSTGELVSAEGTSLLEFTLTSKLRTQRVRQRSRVQIAPAAK